jgi:hypothetical protein
MNEEKNVRKHGEAPDVELCALDATPLPLDAEFAL